MDDQEQTSKPSRTNHFHPSPEKSIVPYPGGPQSLTGRTNWLKIGLIAYIPFAILETSLSGYVAVDPEGYVVFYNITAASSTILQLCIDTLFWIPNLIYICCVVLSCFWIYRAMRNLHTIQSPHVSETPSMAVAWFFVPFANFYKPLRSMQSILLATKLASKSTDQNGIGVMAWWIPFILSIFLGNLEINFGSFNPTPQLQVVGPVLSILAAASFLPLVTSISAMQEEFV